MGSPITSRFPHFASLQRRNAVRRSSGSPSSACTVISFFVSVPVLSEQTTLTAPSVSTDGSLRTIVFTFAILETESARTIVTTAGSPSGTAATAREIAVRNISPASRFWKIAIKNKTAQSPTARMLNIVPRSPNRFCSGVISSGVSWISFAIPPISVSIPVAVTIPSPLPAVTNVDMYAIFFRSPSGVCAPARNPASFSTGTDSPVSDDSCVFKFSAVISRRSAGTCCPALSSTRSPGTSTAESTSRILPSRRTTAVSLVIFFKESSAFCAFPSCATPTAAFKSTTAAMIAASPCSPKRTEITPAANST